MVPYLNVLNPLTVIEVTGAPIINSVAAGAMEVQVPNTLVGNYLVPSPISNGNNGATDTTDDDTTDKAKVDDQVVQVPDTVSRLNIAIYLAGAFFVVVGSIIMTYVARKKLVKVEEK